MQRYAAWFRDNEGRGYPGAIVTVYNAGAPTLPQLFNEGGSITSPAPISNPTTTDPNGYFAFGIANGTYDIHLQGGGMPETIIHNITIGTTSITAIDASVVTFTPAGTITSGTVQAAIEELDADIVALDGDITTLDGLVVHKAGTETITGSKTFTATKTLFGATADATDFPNAEVIISNGDSAHTYVENIGLVAESIPQAGHPSIGVGGVTNTKSTHNGYGVAGRCKVTASGNTGDAVGVEGLSEAIHAGGNNIAFYGNAANGLLNYSFYGVGGKIYNADTTASTSTITGSAVLGGGLGVAGAVFSASASFGTTTPTTVGTAGLLTVANATDATSTTSSASIKTSGGIACAKSIYAVDIYASGAHLTGSSPGYKNYSASCSGASANITMTADLIAVRSATGMIVELAAVSETLNTAASGAGGLDTGSIAASTWYYKYIIYNPTTADVSSLCSLSATAPTLPSGYFCYLRMGAFQTDASGNKYPLACKWANSRAQYKITAGSNITAPIALATGTQGTWSTTAPTWAAIAVAPAVPPTAIGIRVSMPNAYKGGAAAGCACAPNNAYGGYANASGITPPLFISTAVTEASNQFGEMLLESSNIYVVSDAAGFALLCHGYEDSI